MRLALSETVVSGIKTNIALQQMIMHDQGFVTGEKNIHYLEKLLAKEN
jgi:acetyl-CoA carboxylase biotin carboxylase subunit